MNTPDPTIEQLQQFVSRGAAAQQAADAAIKKSFEDLGVSPSLRGVERGRALDAQAKKKEEEVRELQATINRMRNEARHLRAQAYKAFTEPDEPTLYDAAAAAPDNNGQHEPPPPATPTVDPAPGRLGAPEGKGPPIDLAQARACMNWKTGDRARSAVLGVDVDVVAIGEETISVKVKGVGGEQLLDVPATDLSPAPKRHEGKETVTRTTGKARGPRDPLEGRAVLTFAPDDLGLTRERIEESLRTFLCRNNGPKKPPFRPCFKGALLVEEQPHIAVGGAVWNQSDVGTTHTIYLRPLWEPDAWPVGRPHFKNFQEAWDKSGHSDPDQVDVAGVHIDDEGGAEFIIGGPEEQIVVEWPERAESPKRALPPAGDDVGVDWDPKVAANAARAARDRGDANPISTGLNVAKFVAKMYADPPAMPCDGWKVGGPRSSPLPEQRGGLSQSWFQWAPNVVRAVEAAAAKHGAELPGDPRGGRFDVHANEFWAGYYRRGLKPREAASAFLFDLAAALQHEAESMDKAPPPPAPAGKGTPIGLITSGQPSFNADRRHTWNKLGPDLQHLLADPKVNDHGVYEDPETYRVYRAKGCNVEISVAQSSVDTTWRAAHNVTIGSSSSSGPVSVRATGYASKVYALRTEAQLIASHLRDQVKAFNGAHGKQQHARYKAALAATEKFLKSNPHAQLNPGKSPKKGKVKR